MVLGPSTEQGKPFLCSSLCCNTPVLTWISRPIHLLCSQLQRKNASFMVLAWSGLVVVIAWFPEGTPFCSSSASVSYISKVREYSEWYAPGILAVQDMWNMHPQCDIILFGETLSSSTPEQSLIFLDTSHPLVSIAAVFSLVTQLRALRDETWNAD